MQSKRESAELSARLKIPFVIASVWGNVDFVAEGSSKLSTAFCQYRYPSPMERPRQILVGSFLLADSQHKRNHADFGAPTALGNGKGRPDHAGFACKDVAKLAHLRKSGAVQTGDLTWQRHLNSSQHSQRLQHWPLAAKPQASGPQQARSSVVQPPPSLAKTLSTARSLVVPLVRLAVRYSRAHQTASKSNLRPSGRSIQGRSGVTRDGLFHAQRFDPCSRKY